MRATLVLLLLLSAGPVTVTSWFISAPASNKDWEQLAWLVTKSFDAPNFESEVNWKESLRWNLFEERSTYMYNYRHYVQTARRLKGRKYAVFLAKDEQEGGRVVGIAEVGIKVDQYIIAENDKMDTQRRPTIGSLCVDERYRKQGIAKALLQRCEMLVRDVWKDHTIFGEVYIRNHPAFALFTACGYEKCYFVDVKALNGPIMVAVQRRRKMETLPHDLLSKKLIFSDSEVLLSAQPKGNCSAPE